MKKYNWATLGCGVIANELAAAMEKKGEKLYSVATVHMRRLCSLQKNTGSKKFMIILIRFLKTKM